MAIAQTRHPVRFCSSREHLRDTHGPRVFCGILTGRGLFCVPLDGGMHGLSLKRARTFTRMYHAFTQHPTQHGRYQRNSSTHFCGAGLNKQSLDA